MKTVAFMRLAGLPLFNDTFNTQFGDFIFEFESAGAFIDIFRFFRFNVSTRVDNQLVIFHLYEETSQTYLEIPLFDICSFTEN